MSNYPKRNSDELIKIVLTVNLQRGLFVELRRAAFQHNISIGELIEELAKSIEVREEQSMVLLQRARKKKLDRVAAGLSSSAAATVGSALFRKKMHHDTIYSILEEASPLSKDKVHSCDDDDSGEEFFKEQEEERFNDGGDNETAERKKSASRSKGSY